MKIEEIKSLEIEDVKVIRFSKFLDSRGYFTETYNINDFTNQCKFFKNIKFQQVNESFSFENTFRGLHFQWNPFMGKLVRLIYGRLIDFALDLRPNSKTYKNIIAYEVQCTKEYAEWIWLPPGFAHGAWLLNNSMIEYFCSGTYNPNCEKTISLWAKDINWEMCDKNIKDTILSMDNKTLHIKDNDFNGLSISDFEKSIPEDLLNDL
ncbi:MAG: dTDP-4-dehydrorhamnose 3,5-epimerase family protein [Bacteroidetes bacterium]|nr:dTDP-4-dehydrorhamnose 3,5-epimerase family protein [Bacteroidota bacterium]